MIYPIISFSLSLSKIKKAKKVFSIALDKLKAVF